MRGDDGSSDSIVPTDDRTAKGACAEWRSESFEVLKDEPLAKYTSARIGGPADWLLVVESVEALVSAVCAAREKKLAYRVLGSGSNILVAEKGVRGAVILNRARRVVFDDKGRVYAESGANLSSLARSSVARGLAGLEWAVSVPGTVGGAVVGNAGAHGGDIAGSLQHATVLGRDGVAAEWSVEKLEYAYRSSWLKRNNQNNGSVVLAATFATTPGDRYALSKRIDEFVARRKETQPSGASIGSMFKNPPGDYAGRLIDAAGLKGLRRGDAQISPVHANFFVNTGRASADDVKALIDLACEQVLQRFGVELELEIELTGDWGV